MDPKNFFAELKRRNVYKVAVAYAVVGWLLVQVATQVFPFFEIPNWAVRLVVLIIVIGFPIALVIAWAFELTPEGIKRTENVDLTVQTSAKSHAWVYIAIVAALLSIGLFFLGRFNTGEKGIEFRPIFLASCLDVVKLGGQAGFTTDPDQFIEGFEQSISFTAHM